MERNVLNHLKTCCLHSYQEKNSYPLGNQLLNFCYLYGIFVVLDKCENVSLFSSTEMLHNLCSLWRNKLFHYFVCNDVQWMHVIKHFHIHSVVFVGWSHLSKPVHYDSMVMKMVDPSTLACLCIISSIYCERRKSAPEHFGWTILVKFIS